MPKGGSEDRHIGVGRRGHFIRLGDDDEIRFQAYRRKAGMPAARQVIIRAVREFLNRNKSGPA